MQIRNWANVRAVAATAREDRNEYTREEITKPDNPDDSKQEEIIKRSRGGRSIDF